MIDCVLALAFNRPTLETVAKWDSNAITFADISTAGQYPFDIFVDKKNTVYVSAFNLDIIRMWSAGSSVPTKEFHGSAGQPRAFFVTTNGDIFLSAAGNDRIEKFVPSTGVITGIVSVSPSCSDLFVDTNNTLYYSIEDEHVVFSIILDTDGNTGQKIAGIGGAGTGVDMLQNPMGIFVDINFQLYVADCGNHRIQLFPLGQTNANIVAGEGAPGTIDLKCPSDITEDGIGYLFIVDRDNHRIIGSDRNGFRCVAGCTNTYGSTSDQLAAPRHMAFDTYGNIFVSDEKNGRIQKFILRRATDGKHRFPCFILVGCRDASERKK